MKTNVLMLRTRLLFLAPILALTLLATALVSVANAAPPLSVTLNFFRGESVSDGARLYWQTATELDTAGFRILRASDSGGPFQELSEIGFVEARGGPVSGDTYEVLDATVDTGQTYWYRLVEVEQNSSEHDLHTFPLTIGAEPTATLEAVATSDDGDSDGNTQPEASSPTATRTPSPSPSPGTQNQSATNTPRPATATADRQATPTPGGEDGSPIAARPLSEEAETAAPTTSVQPTAIAQATEAYPEPPSANATTDEAYPGDTTGEEQLEPTAAVTETEESYPLAPANGITPERPTAAGGTVADNLPESEESGENAPQQSRNLSRVLLWLGFGAALIIFVAGAVFSILLSTRKQRQDLS